MADMKETAMTKRIQKHLWEVITMKKLTTVTLMVTLGLSLAGCYESGSESTPPPAVEPPPTGVAADGATYYQSNCAACHKLGAVDTTNAFGAADLAQKQDMVASDMSTYDALTGLNLMTTYSAVPAQRVADLKAYFASVPAI
jgi:mono/diheme cytochrome c family protein